MKYIFLILFFLPIVAFSQIIITNGSGGGGTSVSQFDIRKYGADTSLADNKIFIQAAINAAHTAGYQTTQGYNFRIGNAGGGIVVIPPGVWKTGRLESYTNVTIQGQGYLSSQLKAIVTDTLISIHNLQPALANVSFNDLSNTLIKDVALNGDSICNVGLYIDRAANFYIGRTYFHDFTGTGMILRNSLIGTVDGVYMRRNPTGILSYSISGFDVASNHIVFRDCVIVQAKKWAFDLSGGGVTKIDHGDIEVCGIPGDTLTGGIYYHDNYWPGGLTVDNAWFEENQGTAICIMNNAPSGFSSGADNVAVHSIINCQDIGQKYNLLNRNIYISGTNQRLGIVNSYVSGAIKAVVADGSVKINTFGTTISTSTLRGGATLTQSGD